MISITWCYNNWANVTGGCRGALCKQAVYLFGYVKMDMINKLKDKNAVIKSYKSHCGGLVAPESDNNPWNYKFTWNPRNVILAGLDGAKYLKNNLVRTFNYNEVFSKVEKISFYANDAHIYGRPSEHIICTTFRVLTITDILNRRPSLI